MYTTYTDTLNTCCWNYVTTSGYQIIWYSLASCKASLHTCVHIMRVSTIQYSIATLKQLSLGSTRADLDQQDPGWPLLSHTQSHRWSSIQSLAYPVCDLYLHVALNIVLEKHVRGQGDHWPSRTRAG